jgi:alpha-mannosidase
MVEIKSRGLKIGTLKKSPPVYICDSSDSGAHWVVELPSMGSIVLDEASVSPKDQFRSEPLIGEETTLRNEFFELSVDEETGGIRSVQLYKNRVNLISQQLAVRIPGVAVNPHSGGKACYTRMSANEIKLTMESRIAGTITSRGALFDDETKIADYLQSVRVTRGQRVIEVDGEITPVSGFSKSVNHYACSRLAWKSEASRIVANAGEIRQDIYTDWFHATQYIEVSQDEGRLTMLTGGLPYHRRASRRFLDSVLIAGKEQQHKFGFGLGVNLDYPLTAAISRMTPPCLVKSTARLPKTNESSWLFHFNRRNVVATWWAPVFEKTIEQAASGQWAGVKLRLRETEGRDGVLTVRCPRAIGAVERVKFSGESIRSLALAEDSDSSFIIEFGRNDYFEVLIRWKK